MAHSAVASKAMTRRPTKPKKGEPFRMHVILPAEMVELIDHVAAQIAGEAAPLPWTPRPTRTDAVKVLIVEGLRKRGLVK